MPRYKPLSKFPQEFFKFFERAYVGLEEISFPTYYAAAKYRQQLYAFRRALRAENHPLAEKADEITFGIDAGRLSAFNRKTELAKPLHSQEPEDVSPPTSST